MTNVKISARGKEFLRRRNAAAAVSYAIAEQKTDISSKEGVVVKVDGSTFTIKSAASSSVETAEV